MTQHTLTLALLGLSLTVACGDKDADDTGSTDGGSEDGGSSDGGASDGGASDGGSSDGGTEDGGSQDGGSQDGGTEDGGTEDGGTEDGGAEDGGAEAEIEVAGSWIDSWGSDHQVTSESWTSYGGTSIHHISQYDNDQDYAIAQNDEGNAWSAGLWSRFDWTWDGDGGLWYCQTAYAAESEEAALKTPRSDDSDPASGGCGGSFAWTMMSPAR